jgi:hypothetical protein
MLLDVAQRILQSIENSKTWKAEVFVEATNFYSSSTVNLVDYLQSSLMTDKTFPKDSSLRFDNYSGIASRVDIIKYIKERARERGTVLNHKSTESTKSSYVFPMHVFAFSFFLLLIPFISCDLEIDYVLFNLIAAEEPCLLPKNVCLMGLCSNLAP